LIEIDIGEIFREISKDAGKDLSVRELADHDQLYFGTLTGNEINKLYNI
jgi:hypothetical protein